MSPLKTALVTGANKGIGYAICKRLLWSQEFHVILASRNLKEGIQAMDALKRDIPDLDHACMDLVELDVDSTRSIQSSFEYLSQEKKLSALDVLINNAGIASGDEFNSGVIESIFNTNLYGSINCTDTYLPLIQQSKRGRVLMISSRIASITKLKNESYRQRLNAPDLSLAELHELVRSFLADMRQLTSDGMVHDGNIDREAVEKMGWWYSAYGMSKLALSAYVRILANDDVGIKPYGIFVAAFCPGFVRTDMTKRYGRYIPLSPYDGAKGVSMLADYNAYHRYENGKFWCLGDLDDARLSQIDWYNCRLGVPRKTSHTN